jgi:Flp pilus assembly protein TadD
MRHFVFLSCSFLVIVLTLPTNSTLAAKANPAPVVGDAAGKFLPEGRSAQSRALYLTLIDDMRKSGRTHAALAHLDAFEQLYPHGTDAAVMRGNCLVDIGAFEQAAIIYRKLLKTKAAASAYAGLGRIEGLNDRWTAAAGEFSQAVSRMPTDPDYLNDYGYALLRQGRLEEALFRIRQAAELAPANVRVRNNLILVLSATGDTAGSKSLLDSIADTTERADIQAALKAQSAKLVLQAPDVVRTPVVDR